MLERTKRYVLTVGDRAAKVLKGIPGDEREDARAKLWEYIATYSNRLNDEQIYSLYEKLKEKQRANELRKRSMFQAQGDANGPARGAGGASTSAEGNPRPAGAAGAPKAAEAAARPDPPPPQLQSPQKHQQPGAATGVKRKASAAGNTPSISSFFSKVPRAGADPGDAAVQS